MTRHALLLGLLAAAAPTALWAQRAPSPAPPPAAAALDDETAVEELVVTGQRPRGSVVGDIPPEQTISAAEIRSYGVSSINDLLTEVAPATTSGRGGHPVVLLNGRRISGMGELRDIPTEAIQRMEVLPEEVALKYGYAANQKVVNIVLRQRFRATTTQAGISGPTGGGQVTPSAEASMLRIDRSGRTNLGVKYQRSDRLLESNRDLVGSASGPYDLLGNVMSVTDGAQIDPALSALAGRPVTIAGVPASAQAGRPALSGFQTSANASDVSGDRSLLPATEQLSVNAVANRTVFGSVSATLNGTFEVDNSDALLGPAQGRLLIPSRNPFSPFANPVAVYRLFGELGPLHQTRRDIAGHVGATFDGDPGAKWRWNLTTTYDHDRSRTLTDRGVSLTALQAPIDAADPAANPFARLPATPFLRDRAVSTADGGGADLLVTGSPYHLPAGDISTSLKLGASASRLASTSRRAGVESHDTLSRGVGSARLNADLPIASTRNNVLSALGDLSANLNLAVDKLSDFGALTSYGYGLSWTPAKPVSFIVSYSDQETAPTMSQLGGPLILTPDSREFDYVRGQTVSVARISGGNNALKAQEERVLKLGVTWKPTQVDGLSLTANYFRSRTTNPIAALPGGVAEVEAAFPDRFTRDAAGVLQRVDARPVNFARQASDQIRWGFNFSRQIGKTPQPSPEQLAAMRAAAERRAAARAARDDGPSPGGGDDGSPRRPGQLGGDGERSGGRGAGGFGGGFGGGGFRGGGGFGAARALRLQLAVYHTLHLREDVTLRDGLPKLDLLKGGAIGSGGGEPEQEIEVQAGLTKNGLGARIFGKWLSATTVNGGAGASGQLRFSSLTTLNLRLFADLGLQRELVQAHPFFRGSRLSLSVDNLFDTRQRVRDAAGATPVRYQPAYLDALGRTVKLTFRKQFFPQFAPGRGRPRT